MNIIELQDKLEKQNINLSARDICEIWGMNEQNFSRKKKQGTAIKHKNIAQLEKELNISLTDADKKAIQVIEEVERNKVKNTFATIEYFPDVYLSAGYGVEVLDEYSESIVIDSQFLTSERGMRVNPKNCKMVRVSGNSMFPEYHHGDRVIIDESDQNLTDGQIYAFR